MKHLPRGDGQIFFLNGGQMPERPDRASQAVRRAFFFQKVPRIIDKIAHLAITPLHVENKGEVAHHEFMRHAVAKEAIMMTGHD